MPFKKISYVVPCFNEEAVLPEFHARLTRIADSLSEYEFEFIFVNDGSVDSTSRILNELAENDRRIKVLHLARNLGHQNALTAGLDFVLGDVIITIDADLQDPPELINQILDKISQGFDVVHLQRKKRKGESWFKLFTAWGFYKTMGKLSGGEIIENSGDYRAFTRPVLKTVQHFREHHRFLRGVFGAVGFRHGVITYDRDERYAGETKYTLFKMLRFACNGIISFSSGPLQAISWFAILAWSVSLIYLVDTLVKHFIYKVTVPGWTSLVILMTFFSGLTIFSISIIAAYVGRIFEQGQHRPIYWLSDTRNVLPSEIQNSSHESVLFKEIFKNEENNDA